MNEIETPLPPPNQTRQLQRDVDDKMIAGVAAGLAGHFDVDVTLVRLGFAALAIFGGSGLLLYLLAWLIMPAAVTPVETAPAEAASDDSAETPVTSSPIQRDDRIAT